MTLQALLLATPVDEWRVAAVCVFDWHDGPRAGLCTLSVPPVEFHFELIDERQNPDGLNDRLFRVSEVPSGSIAAAQTHCASVAHATLETREMAEYGLREIEDHRQPTTLVISTPDMEHFAGCWDSDQRVANGVGWFAALGLLEGASHGD